MLTNNVLKNLQFIEACLETLPKSSSPNSIMLPSVNAEAW